MPMLIKELNLDPGSRSLFFLKLDMIHQAFSRIREKQFNKLADKLGDKKNG